ncbi:MAG: cytochrome c oxidase subunit 3 [Planctomycetales bacterium]|nr:cytochrome c oxidase subunit 3 [Planctomycetales bacterium]
MLATTLSCATVFLGVKAIEYSHKWHLGLLPAGLFSYDPANLHPEGGPNYLAWICAPFIAITIGVAIWLVVSFLRGAKFQFECAKPLFVVCLFFFVGVGLGTILESGADKEHSSHDTVAVSDAHGSEPGEGHAAVEGHDSHADAVASTDAEPATDHSTDLALIERLASDSTNTGLKADLEARKMQSELASGGIVYDVVDDTSATVAHAEDNVLRPSRAGVFFSIYYCMTGIHAIHILAGIGVMVWLLVRSVRKDFNHNYFGPVDYVGLYWHIVDMIWIYLFPLMYLIR